MSKRLARRGYECKTAVSGTEAFTLKEDFPYKIVLIDIKMPNMDGITAFRAIHSHWPTHK